MSANIQQRIEAAERELAEAKWLLAASEDPCAYQCGEFTTRLQAGIHLRIHCRQVREHGDVLLDRTEALELRRILNIFLGESHQ